MPHLVGRGPLDDLPDGEPAGLLDLAAPHAALPSAGPVDVSAQPAGQHAAVHGRAAVERRLRRTAPGVFHAVVVRLAVDAGHGRGGLEDLRQVRVEVVCSAVADLVEAQPLRLVHVAPVAQRRRVGVRSRQRAERRRAVLLQHQVGGGVPVGQRDAPRRRVGMDGAQQADVGLVAAPDVLDVPHVRLGPGVVLLPRLADVATGHLDERDDPVGVEVVDLPVHALEVGRVDPLEVGNDLLEAGDFAREVERAPAGLVGHLLGASGAGLPPRQPKHRAVGRLYPRRPAVVRPVGEGGDHGDAVELLLPAEPHVVLEAAAGAEGARLVVVVPRVAERGRRPPRVAQQEERRAVGVLEGVAVRRRPDHAPAAGVGLLLGLGPFAGDEPPRPSGQARVAAVRAAPVGPPAGPRRDDADAERLPPVPEAVTALAEARALQVDPHEDVGVGVGVFPLGGQDDLDLFPDVNLVGGCGRQCGHDGDPCGRGHRCAPVRVGCLRAAATSPRAA